MILKALHRRYAKVVTRFSGTKTQLPRSSSWRRQLEVDGGLTTKEEIQQRTPRPFKEN